MKRIITFIIFCFMALTTLAWGQATHVVISAVFGAGGNSGSYYKYDFVELYNPTGSAVDMSTWSIQYASATGTFGTLNNLALTGTIPAHGYWLLQLASGVSSTNTLPVVADQSVAGTTPNLSGTSGKLALASVGTSTPVTSPTDVNVVDYIGYGTASAYEGSAAATTMSAILCDVRKAQTSSTATSMQTSGADAGLGRGYDTDQNSTDFVSVDPTLITLHNSSSTPEVLPVEITSFTAVAENMNTQLKWSTATEVNNYGFDIERRAVASEAWAKVGFVAGAGNSNVAHHYSYADNNLPAGKYAYRIKQIDHSGAFTYTASTEVTIAGMPKELKLYGNYPNPFNPSTKLQFTVAENGKVRLSVYNVLGQEVATLFNGIAEAGNLYTANFDASRMATGIYFSVLEYGNQRITHKMLMTK